MLKLASALLVMSVAADSRADSPRWGWGVHYTFREDAHSIIPGASGAQLERRIHPNVSLALVFDGLVGEERDSMIAFLSTHTSRSMLRTQLALAIGGACGDTYLFVHAGAGGALDHVTFNGIGGATDAGSTWRPAAHIGGGFRRRIMGTPLSIGVDLNIHSLFGEPHHASFLSTDPPSFDTRAAEVSFLVSVHP